VSPTILSDSAFRWTVTVLTLAASLWALYDIVLIAKLRGQGEPGKRDPLLSDKRFGYTIGILLGLFAISGLLRYHDVF